MIGTNSAFAFAGQIKFKERWFNLINVVHLLLIKLNPDWIHSLPTLCIKKSFLNLNFEWPFLKTTLSFWIFRKRIKIVFKNDRFFLKTIWDRFLCDCFFKTIAFEKKIIDNYVNIVNEGSNFELLWETKQKKLTFG